MPEDSIPIRPITGRPSLPPRSHTRSHMGSPYGSPSSAGGLRAYRVPHSHPNGLGPACPPMATTSAAGQLFNPAPGPRTFGSSLLLREQQHLWLVLLNDGNGDSDALAIPSNPAPNRRGAGSRGLPHGSATAPLRGEGYLVLRASHHEIALAARLSRVVGAEPQVESSQSPPTRESNLRQLQVRHRVARPRGSRWPGYSRSARPASEFLAAHGRSGPHAELSSAGAAPSRRSRGPASRLQPHGRRKRPAGRPLAQYSNSAIMNTAHSL